VTTSTYLLVAVACFVAGVVYSFASRAVVVMLQRRRAAASRQRPQHADPHFNESGGCQCHCPLCLTVRIRKHGGHLDIRQVCVCRGCTEDCPSIDRVVMECVEVR
jgi:hypothetical protein